MRGAFARALDQCAKDDPRVVFLTGDLGFQVFDRFQEAHGPRYVNAGIAEAQMVCAAAGLALEGFRPVIYSIASFMTARPFEQIRVCLAYPGLPVVLVGAGGGYCYASSGVTHHAPDDLALMALLPGMTIVCPGDPGEVEQLLPQLLRLPGPSYMRVGKFGEAALDAEEDAVLGRARRLRSGRGIAILTTGDLARQVLDLEGELAALGIAPWVYQVHTLNPLDLGLIDDLAGKVRAVLVVEEASPVASLASQVRERVQAVAPACRVERLGPSHAFVLGNPSREALMRREGYGPEAILDACRRLAAYSTTK